MNTLAVLTVCLLGGAVSVCGQDLLKITLFYESYCPFCIRFIQCQLSSLGLFKDNFSLDLVPYGNAQQSYKDGHFEFICQHGPKECLANKLHACAIRQACGETGSAVCDKLDHVLQYISCLTQQPDQEQANPECAKSAGLVAEDIAKCAKGDEGNKLLSFYGNQTSAFTPHIEGVPTVAINGEPDDFAGDSLVFAMCSLKPQLCVRKSSPKVVQV